MSNNSSGRSCRLKTAKYLKGRDSNSPTLSSSQSSRSLWARSYKNQPIPTELRTRLIGKKFQFDDDEDQQEILAVQEQEQQQPIEKKKRLPLFKVISDEGQFSQSRRNRLKSERKSEYYHQRCQSVASLRLPQVPQQKRQDDELRKKILTKLAEFKDKNQFGQNKRKRRSSSDFTQVVSKVESLQLPSNTQISRVLPQEIQQNQAQETKSVKLAHEKSLDLHKANSISKQILKLVVDQIDQKKKIKQQMNEQIESIIEQEKPELEVDKIDTQKLSQLLSKFEEQSSYLKKINDEQDFSKKTEQIVKQIIQQNVQQQQEQNNYKERTISKLEQIKQDVSFSLHQNAQEAECKQNQKQQQQQQWGADKKQNQ